MTTLDLKTSLLDLLHEIEGSGIRLIIGGGFGLYLKMELEDSNKEFGRYHALDLYSILATTSESEWRQGLKMRDRYGTDPYVMEAGALVSSYFSSLDSLGILRLKESP